jgi:hypothetical protein
VRGVLPRHPSELEVPVRKPRGLFLLGGLSSDTWHLQGGHRRWLLILTVLALLRVKYYIIKGDATDTWQVMRVPRRLHRLIQIVRVPATRVVLVALLTGRPQKSLICYLLLKVDLVGRSGFLVHLYFIY